MGQYFKHVYTTVRTNDGVYVDSQMPKVVLSDEGSKLLELGWSHNATLNNILYRMSKTKMRYALVGDYSDRKEVIHYEDYADSKDYYKALRQQKKRLSLHYLAWGEFSAWNTINFGNQIDTSKVIDPDDDGWNGWYLVNHSKKEFIRLGGYVYRSKDKNGEVIHPLAMLCCLSDGLDGCGYYQMKYITSLDGSKKELVTTPYVNADKAGCWAWDVLSMNRKEPSGYTEKHYYFVCDTI